MPKQTLFLSSTGLYSLPCCITVKEMDLDAAGRIPAACSMLQRFLLSYASTAKLEWLTHATMATVLMQDYNADNLELY